MPTVTVSSKNQITLPADIVRSFGLKAGDKLIVEAIDWRIVLMRESENKLEQLRGSMKGAYGSTLEEIDQYVADERRSIERDEWREEFYDILARDSDAEKIVNWLRNCPHRTSPEPDVLKVKGVNRKRAAEVLEALTSHGGVRRIPPPVGIDAHKWQYRLVREFAESAS